MAEPSELDGILPSLLGDDDLELKRLFVRRYCSVHPTVQESDLVSQLHAAGRLTSDGVRLWAQLSDVDELIAEARRKSPVMWAEPAAISPADSRFRKAATFTDKGLDPAALPTSSGPKGSVDTSASEAKGLLRRLRGSKKGAASQREVVHMRKELERADACAASLLACPFLGLRCPQSPSLTFSPLSQMRSLAQGRSLRVAP